MRTYEWPVSAAVSAYTTAAAAATVTAAAVAATMTTAAAAAAVCSHCSKVFACTTSMIGAMKPRNVLTLLKHSQRSAKASAVAG
eukprot:10083-Heterococcus_DN1.PRE.2